MDAEPSYRIEIARLRRRFAVKLRSRREDRYHSQEAFAEHARLHRTTIGGLEQGRTDPRLSTLLIVAQALEVSIGDLLEGLPVPHERKPPPPVPASRLRASTTGGSVAKTSKAKGSASAPRR